MPASSERARRRSYAASTYSGIDSTSSATNTTIRSLAAAIVSMPGDREEQQRDVLGARLDAAAHEVVGRQQQREQRADDHHGADEHREAVDRGHVRHRVGGAVVDDDAPLLRQEERRAPRGRARRSRARARRCGCGSRAIAVSRRIRIPAATGMTIGAIEYQSTRGMVDGRDHRHPFTPLEVHLVGRRPGQVGLPLEGPHHALDRGLDAVDHRLRVEADEERQREQRHHDDAAHGPWRRAWWRSHPRARR